MDESRLFQLLANVVLSIHVAIVLFVIVGLVLVVAGNLRGWQWVNSFWYRLVHLATIAIVAAQAWLGYVCSLTRLEMWLRGKAQANTYSGSFIEHWLHAFLFWEAPLWVFTAAYTTFGLVVVATWWYFPPKS